VNEYLPVKESNLWSFTSTAIVMLLGLYARWWCGVKSCI